MNKTKMKVFVMQMERFMTYADNVSFHIRAFGESGGRLYERTTAGMILTDFFCDSNEVFYYGKYLPSEGFSCLYEAIFDDCEEPISQPTTHPSILSFISGTDESDIKTRTQHLLIKCDEGVVVNVSVKEGENEDVIINTFIEGKWEEDIERLFGRALDDKVEIPISMLESLAVD